MSGQSEKNKRKEILRQLKAKEKADFSSSLPMDKGTFQQLFNHLDENLGEECDHEMTLTTQFLEEGN